jgi:hypothetical protein
MHMSINKASIMSTSTLKCPEQNSTVDFAVVTKQLENGIRLAHIDVGNVASATGKACVHGAITDDNKIVAQLVKRGTTIKSSPVTVKDYPKSVVKLLERKRRTKITRISQRDFDHGTYRITKSGTYKLTGNIMFGPNVHNKGMPTLEQRSNDGHYSGRAYGLGFFAAITIETSNVVLDFDGFTIEQSVVHQRQQRFYAHIELSSTPFPNKAGPADFGLPEPACHNIIIRNGTLGRSAHHGIHGNQCTIVVLENLIITGQEVAAISINGSHNVLIRHIRIGDIGASDFSSALSQATFANMVLAKIAKRIPGDVFAFRGGAKTVKQVQRALEHDLASVTQGARYAPEYMRTTSGRSDCNAYGIVMAGKGVHVGLASAIPVDHHNSNIVLHDITIEHVHTHPVEILAHACPGLIPAPKGGAYGAPRSVGPFGDVINIRPALDENGYYIAGNALLDAQMVIAALGVGPEERGNTNVCDRLLTWAQGEVTLDKDTDVYLKGGDSMGHDMKGNHGLFFPRAHGVLIAHVHIGAVINHGLDAGFGAGSTGICIGKAV